ncbi:hypothetical protein PoB_004047100 [Plakobranchus ocellatus]|uniref:Uncharacterized protein n=1 Tax=Plakobranchus ocellatus TaxID=259542 RepID=A0AAV4B582_9GAST|nr:hypothetical protein PoB_004047100 [Plakobranchus ocellatus]
MTDTNGTVNASLQESMDDSLRTAVLARGIKGYHETEVSLHGEADLHQSLIDCSKNPGHNHFVPFSEFDASHLPEPYSSPVLEKNETPTFTVWAPCLLWSGTEWEAIGVEAIVAVTHQHDPLATPFLRDGRGALTHVAQDIF